MDELPTKPIDLRGLEPPQPLLRVLEALDEARAKGGEVVFLLPRAPDLIYGMLRADGWRYRVRMLEAGCELTVFRDFSNP